MIFNLPPIVSALQSFRPFPQHLPKMELISFYPKLALLHHTQRTRHRHHCYLQIFPSQTHFDSELLLLNFEFVFSKYSNSTFAIFEEAGSRKYRVHLNLNIQFYFKKVIFVSLPGGRPGIRILCSNLNQCCHNLF